MYGKLIDSSVFPVGSVTWRDELAAGKPQSGEYPVIREDDKGLWLLWIQGGTGSTKVMAIPRDKILQLDYFAPTDVLQKIFSCQLNEIPGDPLCQ
jgi:hypothetical protein